MIKSRIGEKGIYLMCIILTYKMLHMLKEN